ncbi:hypothetical protein ACIGD1_01490 [Streptomyces sp. NPDC085612]|uniref:hypothetical protein n=1 Tax=Streptomyces sp. NPDC085612 TaxID=3365732 RepID=UPI0037D83707
MSAGEIVDIDDPGGWPADVREFVASLAGVVPARVRDGGDLPYEVDLAARDAELRMLLAGRWLRSFHATRLLPYEVEGVQASGLRRLTEALVEGRQDEALRRGEITQEEHAALRGSSVFKWDRWVGLRKGKVCLVANAQPLHEMAGNFVPLLANWGGEAQYMTNAWEQLDCERVKKLGTPSIVVALLDVADPEVAVGVGHELIYAFVASHLGMANVRSRIDFESDIPSSCIEGVWQPGSCGYDQFTRLPRS